MLSADFFDFVIGHLLSPTTPFSDLPWLLTTLQALIVSPHFTRFSDFPTIAQIALSALSDGPDTILVQSLAILSTVLLCDMPAVRAMAAADAVLERVIGFLDPATISDIGAVFDFLTNYVSIDDDLTIKAVRAGVLDRVHDVFEGLEPSLQARALDLAANIAVSPAEATAAVFRGPFAPIAVDLLQAGGMGVRRAAARLLLHLAARTPPAPAVDFLLERGAIPAIAALLESDDVSLLETTIRCLMTIAARVNGLPQEQRAAVAAELEPSARERIAEIALVGHAGLAQLAGALVEVLRLWDEDAGRVER
jgi:hypothetical protein